MVKVGIVGAGYIGCIHGRVLHRYVHNARVVGVTDAVSQKAEQLAEELGASAYPDLLTLLSSAAVDAVAICTPTATHAPYLTLAAEQGKHVFCEKPLAYSVEEADQMAEAVKKNGVSAMSGHVLRFWPVYVRAKEIVDSGELGKPLHGYCERLLALPDWQEGGWHLHQKQGCAAALDVQIHDLDYLAWLFGKPLKIRSSGLYDTGRGGWMHMNSRVEFEKGQVGLVQAGWGFPASYPFTMTIRILCERGTVEWNFKAGKLLETRDREAPLVVYKNGDAYIIDDIDQSDPFLLQWRYFIDCLDQNKDIERATLKEGRTALKLALGSIHSAMEGKEVSLTE